MRKIPPHIAEAAAEHVIRRTSDVPEAPRDGLEEWLRADSRHPGVYCDAQALWEQLGDLRDDEGLQAIKRLRLKELRRERKKGLGSRLLALAAAFVILVGGTYGAYLLGFDTPKRLQYATELGELRTETLADGTQVVLNTDTALQTGFTRSQREVELLRGEAQFDVTHDVQRPFVVRLGRASVTALGTRFQVRRDGDGALVTLLEGSVELALEGQRRVLMPNEQARLTPAGNLVVTSIEPDAVDGWLNGWLRFRATPLEQVIFEANRYSAHKLRLGDPSLAEVELNGNFRAGNSRAIANAATMILPVRVEERDNETLLLPQ